MKKNDLVEIQIEDMSSEGLGIGHASGMAVFVKDAVIGDRVRAKAVKVKKTYAYARLEEILTPGPDRVEPVCPDARRCGGCQIQEMSYPAQLRLKERKVRENLARIGGIDWKEYDTAASRDQVFLPIIGMKEPWHYRNKAQFPVGEDREGNLIAGFYAGRTHTIIDNHRCEIGIIENQAVLETVLSWMKTYGVHPYSEQDGSGEIRHVCIRAGFSTGELMIVIVANAAALREEQALVSMLLKASEGWLSHGTLQRGQPADVQESVKRGLQHNMHQRTLPAYVQESAKRERNHNELKRTLQTDEKPGYRIRSIVLNTNRERTNVILGKQNRILYGDDFIEDRIGHLTYRISAGSFYQVNPVQTEVLYKTALEYAALTGQETVWDLYCGTGTISLFLAQRARRVIGIEIVPEAVQNARENARRNHIDNCEFITGRAEELAGDLPDADVIVVDPPRKGLDPSLTDTILRVRPERIVYVSCDSATLARDLAILTKGEYELRKVQPVDQFCHTVHVETVVLLGRKSEGD